MTEKIKVLCVEDEFDIRENIIEILNDAGFEAFGAKDGKDGLTKLGEFDAENLPDIIISDIMMPNMSGYEMLEKIRKLEDKKIATIPFIFLTALSQKADIIKGANLTANDYLTKPIDFDLLISKINEKVKNRKNLDEYYDENIELIKDQIAMIIPSEIGEQLNNNIAMIEMLSKEPFGQLTQDYLDLIGKILTGEKRLKSVLNNSISKKIIEKKLNQSENLINIFNFTQEYIANQSENVRNRIEVIEPKIPLPEVKIDSIALKKTIISSINEIAKEGDEKAKITIKFTISSSDSLVVIISTGLKSVYAKNPNYKPKIGIEKINSYLQDYAIYSSFKIHDEKIAIFTTIPKYKLVKSN